MPFTHLDDVPEEDREQVQPSEIDAGISVFHGPNDHWVLIDRVTGPPTSQWWALELDAQGKCTFGRFTSDERYQGGMVATGKPMRRKRFSRSAD
jgi:hypothetical protein